MVTASAGAVLVIAGPTDMAAVWGAGHTLNQAPTKVIPSRPRTSASVSATGADWAAAFTRAHVPEVSGRCRAPIRCQRGAGAITREPGQVGKAWPPYPNQPQQASFDRLLTGWLVSGLFGRRVVAHQVANGQ